jgi:hypothetical protein
VSKYMISYVTLLRVAWLDYGNDKLTSLPKYLIVHVKVTWILCIVSLLLAQCFLWREMHFS